MGFEICKDFCEYCRMRRYYGSNYRLEILRQIFKDLLDNIDYFTNETNMDLSVMRNKGKLLILLIEILKQEYKKLEIIPD